MYLFVWFLERIARLSLIRHSLYVGLVEKTPPPSLTGEQYGKMEPKYPVFYVIRGGGFNIPPLFLLISVDGSAI